MENQTRVEPKEIFLTFLRLGVTAFGGPVAHIGMMEEEIVGQKKWITNEDFLDMLSISNLIPGPNSTELAISIGYRLGGVRGLVLAGTAFIFPAMAIVMAIGLLYLQYGALPELRNLLMGIQPVVLGIILLALYRLFTSTVKSKTALFTLSLLVVWLIFFRTQEIVILLAGAFLYYLFSLGGKKRVHGFLPPIALAALPLPTLFGTFFKIGALLYGSGYVLIAFLQSEFVERLGVLTKVQLMDAVAIGQVTPGPLFTTATFIGTIIAGPLGGVVGTVGIFLPSFLLVGFVMPQASKIRKSKVLSKVLDGVNIASLALLVSVTLKLIPSFVFDPFTVILFVMSGVLLFTGRVKSHWLILAGGVIGLVSGMI